MAFLDSPGGKRLQAWAGKFFRKKFVHIRMEMKLYPRSGEKPLVLAVSASRGKDGEFHVDYPEDFSEIKARPKSESSRRLQEAFETAKVYCLKYESQNKWDHVVEKARWYITNGGNPYALRVSRSYAKSIAQTGYRDHLEALYLAAAFYLDGMAALESGNLRRAAFCASEAARFTSKDFLLPNPRKKFQERSSTGGKKKANRLDSIMSVVARLFVELMPDGGWESKLSAKRRVIDEVKKMHSKVLKESTLDPYNLMRTIGGWMKKEPDRFHIRVRDSSK